MQELLEKIQSDSTMMLMAIMAFVVLLIIVLIVIVSAMRVKKYRNRFWGLQNKNENKSKQILLLKEEVQALKIKNATNEQELQQFAETKQNLGDTVDKFSAFQEKHTETEKELSQTQALLSSKESVYLTLLEEHKELKERQEKLIEENSKFRTNNARLLMKIESEEICQASKKQ